MRCDEWKVVKLKDVCSIKYGKDHKKLNDGNIPAYGSGGLMRYVDSAIHNKKSVLIPRKGTLSNLFLVEPPFWTVDTLFWTDINLDLIIPDFLYYQLCIMDLASKNVGTAVPSLTTAILNELDVILPSIEEQKHLISILCSIERKIETNQKINDNLLQQAQSLFNDWFVRFTPFDDDEFVASPIEIAIPKSLSMIQIADIPHVLETGRRPKGGAASSGIPSVGAENVKQLGKFDFSSNKYIPEDFAAKQKTGRINGYELLLYKDGGKPGTFIPHYSMFGEGFPYSEFFINEHVFKLDFFDRGKNIFAYFYMQTDYATSWLANNGGKAAIPGINQQDVRAIWIYDLEHPQVQRFCRWVEPLFKTIFCNCYENMKLAELRDTLLPKLMSGKIDVSSIRI